MIGALLTDFGKFGDRQFVVFCSGVAATEGQKGIVRFAGHPRANLRHDL